MKLEQLHLEDFNKTKITPKLSVESIQDLDDNSIPIEKINFKNITLIELEEILK